MRRAHTIDQMDDSEDCTNMDNLAWLGTNLTDLSTKDNMRVYKCSDLPKAISA